MRQKYESMNHLSEKYNLQSTENDVENENENIIQFDLESGRDSGLDSFAETPFTPHLAIRNDDDVSPISMQFETL